MHDAFFVAGIELIPVNAPVNRVVDKMLVITNDHGVIGGVLSPSFVDQVGKLELRFLTSEATLIAYWLAPIDVDLPRDPSQLHVFLLSWLVRVRRFLLCLWLVKDNAASTELGYAEAPHNRRPTWIWRNFWVGVISKADGSRTPTTITSQELDRACELYVRTMGRFESELKGGKGPTLSRWNNAAYFLDNARIVENPGMKVAQYCTCLEALFGTDKVELAHKLAERVAWFLETNASERLKTYHTVKTAYTLRSKVVHGDKKAIVEGLKAADVAIGLDQLVRRILLRILEEPEHTRRFVEGHDKGLEEYFSRLMFGVEGA